MEKAMSERARRRRKERSRRMAANCTAVALGAMAVSGILLIAASGTEGEPMESEERYYISDDYYYTNYEDYLQAVNEREAYIAEEQEKARRESEELRKSIEEYEARQQEAAEENFRAMQEELHSEIPEAYDDIPLLWNMVEAEAGNQDLMGKRLVAGVALNRVDSPDWPDTLTEVITQPYQFSSYWDGGMERFSEISESTKEAVALEIRERSYPGLVYFTAEGYSKYGTPYFKYGDHYFSTE